MNDNPFKDFTDVFNKISLLTKAARCDATAYYAELLPEGLESSVTYAAILGWLSQMQDSKSPKVEDVHLCMIASSYEALDVSDIKKRFQALSCGSDPLNHLCVPDGLGLRVLDMALELPHFAGAPEPVSSEAATMAGIAFGMEATASGGDIVALCDMAPNNYTAALSVIAAVSPACWQKLIESELLDANSIVLVDDLLRKHGCYLEHIAKDQRPLEAVRRLGGREMAALCGAIVAGASQSIALLLDGWSALAAAHVLVALPRDDNADSILMHSMAASSCNEAQQICWRSIGMEPIMGINQEIQSGLYVPAAVRAIKEAICEVQR